MERITVGKAAVSAAPEHVALVCSRKPDGTTNLATVSWWTFVSFHPASMTLAMSRKSFTGTVIRNTKELLITIPGESLKDAVMGCGKCSGRDYDKAEKFGIAMTSVPGTEIKAPVHSRMIFHCALTGFQEIGDHYFYILEIKDIFENAEETALYAWKGYSEIDPVSRG